MRSLLSLFAAVALVACAGPQTARPTVQGDAVAAEQQRMSLYALERRQAEFARVYTVGERLRIANADLCPDRENAIGVQFETVSDYARDLQPAARELWGLSDIPTVNWVGDGSPAQAAGVRIRDRLLAINGAAPRAGRRASSNAARTLRTALQRGDVSLRLQRGAETVELTVTPVSRCGYGIFVSDMDGVNAFADGELIAVQRDMLRFVENDDELALILGHEMAHNAMRHIQKRQQNAMMGSIGGAVLDVLLVATTGVSTGGAFQSAGSDAGASMFSQAFESEADYVGMYYLVRAGYSPDGVEEFWRRMAAENPRGVRFAFSHPNHAERFLALGAARQEIALVQAQGLPLRPRMEGDAPVIPTTAAQATAVQTETAAPAARSEPALEPQIAAPAADAPGPVVAVGP